MEITRAPRDFVADLETKLLSAAERLNSRRRAARRIIAVASVLAALFIGGAIVPFNGGEGGGPRPALAIEREPESVRIRLLGAAAEPDAVREELAAAGITAEVESVPVSPSLEGTWVTAELPDGGNVNVVDGAVLVARRPVESLRLIYGRPADAGERYQVSASAFASGEALHCVSLLGLQADEAASVLNNKGLSVSWRQHLPADSSGHGETIFVDRPPPGIVVDATPDAPGEVIVFAADPASADKYYEPVDSAGCS